MTITAQQLREFAKIFEPKTYFEQEGNTQFTTQDFSPGYLNNQHYYAARASLVRSCVDALLAYTNENHEKGILLITRKEVPAKGQLWPVGGAIPRETIGLQEALKANAKRETGLELDDLVYLGAADFGWATTPYASTIGGKGLRETGHIYYAHAQGPLQLGPLDNEPLIVTPKLWEQRTGRLANLHPYVADNLDKAMILLIDDYYR